jgi:predicted RND superfamily exporter protein
MSRRKRIEAGFTAWGWFIIRWRWLAILSCLALTTLLVWRLPEIRVDNSDEAFLHEGDSERARYDRFKETFDREDRVSVVLHTDRVFDLGFLEQLRALHRDLENDVPYLEEVTSLVNARNTRGEDDELIVEDFMEDWPQNDADVAALAERALANPFYLDNLINEDATYTILSLKPFTYSDTGGDDDALGGFEEGGADAEPVYLTDTESYEFVDALYAVIERHESPDFEAFVIGGPTFDYRMTRFLQQDVTLFMSLSLTLQFLLLFALFRRISGVVLPIVVVVSAMISTVGFMVWIDIPFSITLNILPGFLLVVGLCDSVHLLTIVYRQLAAGSSREEAIAFALGHSGLAVVMTSLTTAAGLASFYLADLAPVSQLGILLPVGVMLALIYSLVLLPGLLAVWPLRAKAPQAGIAGRGIADRLLARIGDVATQHPVKVVASAAAIVLLALPGLLQVHFSHDGIRWFPPEDPIVIAEQVFNTHFKGASSLEVLVHTGVENGLYEPDTLQRIQRLMDHSRTLEIAGHPIGKTFSLTDVVKETHQALNENRSDYYRLPEERALIAQELLLFENSGSDDLEDLTDRKFMTARVSVRTPWVDAMLYPAFIDEVNESYREILGDDLDFELTGGAVLFTRIFEGVIKSMARSYVFALIVITPMLVLLIGSLKRGLVAMIPNLIPVYLTLAFMGFNDIPLDAGTLLIGGIIIGLAVDDTIHFMHRFGRYYEDTGDPARSVHETLATTGTALLFTSVALCAGFSVFLASYMRTTLWFGLLTTFGIAVAFVADILLAPALMMLVTKRRAPAQHDSIPVAAG